MKGCVLSLVAQGCQCSETSPERGNETRATDSYSEYAKISGLQTIEPYSTYTQAFDHVALVGTFVELSERRQGIGTRLSQAIFEAARRKGYEKIFTYLRADNLSSLAFYLQFGFRIVGTAEKQAKGDGYVRSFYATLMRG